MRFKPVPDSIRCATVEADYMAVTMKEGKPLIYVTDSAYVAEHIISPVLEGVDTHWYIADGKEPLPSV